MSQAIPVLDDQVENDRTRQFQEFLDDRVCLNLTSNLQGVYADAIKNMLDRKSKRLVVSLDDLRAHSSELCNGYIPQSNTNT